MNKKVLLALSGGVDSSVAVHLLRQQGYYVEALCIDFSPAHQKTVAAAKCVAEQMDIKLHVVTCHDLFYKNVVEPFANHYLSGITPNPCILCNPTTKFHILDVKSDELGFEYFATGHYADIAHYDNDTHLIKKAGFIPRDQSYMLYRLTQTQLKKLILPLHSLPKDEVRRIAEELNLPSAKAPDSQEICFIPDNDYSNYIRTNFGESKAGKFISPDGEACGNHKGILNYTVGQRKGLGISLGYPVFIKSINSTTGDIFLARKGDEFDNHVILNDCVFHPHPDVSDIMNLSAKIRSASIPAPCKIVKLPNGKVSVEFEQPQRAPAPGQSCVLYLDDYVIGGGFIE